MKKIKRRWGQEEKWVVGIEIRPGTDGALFRKEMFTNPCSGKVASRVPEISKIEITDWKIN